MMNKDVLNGGRPIELDLQFDPAGPVQWQDTIEAHKYRITIGWRVWEFRARLRAVRHLEEAALLGAEIVLSSWEPPVRLPLWRSVPLVLRHRWQTFWRRA